MTKDQERATLQRRHVDHLANEDKNNDVNMTGKSSEAAEYLYITICGKHDYRRHKPRMLLPHNQASTLFAEGYVSNGIVTCNFSQKHRLIVVSSNTSRHFRLDGRDKSGAVVSLGWCVKKCYL